MWTKKSTVVPLSEYEKKIRLPKPPIISSSKPYIILNGHHRVKAFEKLCERHESISLKVVYKKLWEDTCRAFVEPMMWEEKPPKYRTFGISRFGIKVKKDEISIDPEKLNPNVFYLFSYKDEKYVTRKTDEGIVEVFEVIE